MNGPTHAVCYADAAVQRAASIECNERIAHDTYLLRVRAPDIARGIVPGQFVMMRLPGSDDPLLARPLALYDTVLSAEGASVAIDVVYLVVGKLTSRLAQMPVGAALELWGPLGNGFTPAMAKHLVMVAGGIGQTPFLALAQEALGKKRYGEAGRVGASASRVTLCYGARSASYLAGIADFQALGVEVQIATDDGTAGQKGFVTGLLPAVFDASPGCRVVCCGPERMMEKVAALALARDIPCEVSLETPMACGIGICFSCVARVDDGQGGWYYRRTCVEGPVFDARRIRW